MKEVGTGINEDLIAHKEMRVGSDDPIGQLDLVEEHSSIDNTITPPIQARIPNQ